MIDLKKISCIMFWLELWPQRGQTIGLMRSRHIEFIFQSRNQSDDKPMLLLQPPSWVYRSRLMTNHVVVTYAQQRLL